MKKQLMMFEIVKIVELKPILCDDERAESFRFRIEILKECGPGRYFFAHVYRIETFRIQPSFPIGQDGTPESELYDEEIIIKDITQQWEKFRGEKVDDVLENVLKTIREIFTHSNGFCGKITG